eukprot:CAMPEP_0113876094 /NCGR_PEP_ID=MMETSP0780_2-20120614/5296_1 /TAXON_ID=652834 /ORGANISM="Palpitomonas bilix" /LENGTH=514 /DNA_ID=CAMNT_0000862135 /DNA_START=384 /DNA_END=1928 /DNA_ORIENTATION=- /assembly_acc=CAM_ASM_000599
MAFVGHLSTADFAAVATALVWQNITIQFINQGIAGSVKALAAQARGANNKELESAWLSIGLLFGLVGGGVMMGLWAMTEMVIPLLNDDSEVISKASMYNYIVLPICVPELWYSTSISYLQAQGRVVMPVVINLAFVGVNALLNWVLVFGVGEWQGMGLKGAAIATLSSRMCMYAVFFAVVLSRRYYDAGTVRGIQRRLMTRSRVIDFLRQFVPLAVGRLLEELQLQVVIILAAQLGKAQVSAHSAFLQLFFVVATAMYGAVEGVVVRMGHRVGEGDEIGAKTVLNLAYIICAVIGLLWSSIFILARNVIGAVFSDDESVQLLMASIAPIVGAGFFLLSLFYGAVAALRGMGRPGVFAIAFLVGGWVIAVPLSVVDVVVFNFSCPAADAYIANYTDAAVPDGCGHAFVGLWWCLSAGYLVITIIANMGVAYTNFASVIKMARKRSEAKLVRGEVEERGKEAEAESRIDEKGRESEREDRRSGSVSEGDASDGEGGEDALKLREGEEGVEMANLLR